MFHFQQLHPTWDVIEWARDHRDSIGHIQIAQSPKRNEPHNDGEIDYKSVLPKLKELFPELYVGLEYKPSGPITTSLMDGKAVNGLFDYTATG